MIKFKANDQEYQLKTSWSEFDYKTFALMQSATIWEKITYCCGMESELIGNLSAGQLSWILEAIKFIDELPEMYEDVALHWDVGDCTYGQMEASKQAFEKADNHYLAIIDIVEIYCKSDISEMPLMKSLGYAMYFFEQFNEFFEQFKGLSDYELEEGEIMAGVEQLGRFGFYPTMMALARKMGQTYDQVLNMSAREVYMTMLVDKEQADYKKRLYEYERLQNQAK